MRTGATRRGHIGGARHAAAAGVTLLAAGCAAVVPSVDYRPLAADPAGGGVPYQLTGTLIVVGAARLPSAEEPAPLALAPSRAFCSARGCFADAEQTVPIALAAVAVPVADAGRILAVHARDRRFVKTALSPTYFANSLRLRTLTVEATDHRLEAINTVGTIVAGLAKLAAGNLRLAQARRIDGGLRLPLTVRLGAVRGGGAVDLSGGGSAGWSAHGRFETDAAALGLMPVARAGDVHAAMLTSSCRPFTLTLSSGEATIAMSLTVADPEWLYAIPFPPKGAVVFAPLCGADVQPQPVTRVGADALAEAFFAQVRAVADAAR